MRYGAKEQNILYIDQISANTHPNHLGSTQPCILGDVEAWQEFTRRERPNAIYFDAEMPLSEQELNLQALLQDHL